MFVIHSSMSQNRFQTLQQRIDVQQDEIFRLETCKKTYVLRKKQRFLFLAVQDYRSKFEILREENDNLLKQVIR